MNEQTVLIIADHHDFARDVVGRWQMERTVPCFTLMSSELWETALAAPCELAIVGGLRESLTNSILGRLEAQGIPCIFVSQEDSAMHQLRSRFPRLLAVREHDGWLDSLVVLATEVLRRVDAATKARKAETAANQCLRQAALGRYMLETRHSFNNALTSVLGNAELMMLEPATIPDHMREQVDTIHSMALRLHEMMQRFSSLETEMHFADRESQNDTSPKSQTYVAGS